MQTVTCYLAQTGKAFQQPLNCLKFEFDHLVAEFRTECQAIILHRYAREVFEAHLRKVQERFAALEAKAQEFYALVDRLEAPKPAQLAESTPLTNVIVLPHKQAA